MRQQPDVAAAQPPGGEAPGGQAPAGAALPVAARSPCACAPRISLLCALRDYLVAASAQDCALVVALQRVPQPPAVAPADPASALVWDHVTGASYRCAVTVVDLDVKRCARLPAHAARDARLAADWRASCMTEDRC